MESSLSSTSNTQSITDYFKNMPRIWPVNISTAPNPVWATISTCLDYCNNLQARLSLLPPFLPSLSILNRAAGQVPLEYKSDHITQNLGQAPHYIQSKHWNSSQSSAGSVLLSQDLPLGLPPRLLSLTLSIPAPLGALLFHKYDRHPPLRASVWPVLLSRTLFVQTPRYLTPSPSSNFAQNATFSVKSILTTRKAPCAPFQPPQHHPPYSIILLVLMFVLIVYSLLDDKLPEGNDFCSMTGRGGIPKTAPKI